MGTSSDAPALIKVLSEEHQRGARIWLIALANALPWSHLLDFGTVGGFESSPVLYFKVMSPTYRWPGDGLLGFLGAELLHGVVVFLLLFRHEDVFASKV